ncbi:MAG: sigma-54 dependent transcriptional regulator [Pseudomonadota bacterium]
MTSVLLVDDEPDILDLLSITLIQMGVHPVKAASLAQARQHLLSGDVFALCLTDLRLPDGEGTELLNLIEENHLDIPVAVITAHGSQSSAVEAMKKGAFDYLNKPIGLEQLRALIKSVIQVNPIAKKEVAHALDEGCGLLGQSLPIVHVRNQIQRIAPSQAPVHIFGESGSGKERAARLIHACSRQAAGAFVAVNCGAIPESLMESEFFGHRKGSFTGADRDHIGFFQAAHGGTLFLDEIAELPLSMQVKLLRAIQEKSIRRVGSTEETSVSVRVLSATHRPLREWVAQGLFRQDLYYRINVIELTLPPLRELREDIVPIAQAILKRLAPQETIALSPATQAALMAYSFPGNVRELENLMERALALRMNPFEIQVEDLGFCETSQSAFIPATDHHLVSMPESEPAGLIKSILQTGSLENYLDNIEKQALEAALLLTQGNRTAAAQTLGISFRSMRYRLDRLNLTAQGDES